MALPTVHQTEVPEQGLSLTCLVHPEELLLSPDEGRFLDDLTLEVEINQADRGLDLHGVLSGHAVRECVRCLVEYDDPIRVPFSAEYRVHERSKGKEGRGQGPGRSAPSRNRAEPVAEDESEELDEDIYPYDGEQLQMADMLREHVILSSPLQPLCREDCLGLCPVCGQNRNEQRCGCPEPEESSPFAVLRQLRPDTADPAIRSHAPVRKRSNRNQQ
jgi:uncharacterized protein